TVVLAQHAGITRGLFIGEDTTRPGANGPEIYEDPRNHATAAASILKYIATKAKYDPRNQSPSKDVRAYRRFIDYVSEFDAFKHGHHYSVSLDLDGELPDLQNKIEKQYPFEDKASIARQLCDALPEYNRNPFIRRWEISLILIRKPYSENEVTVEVIKLNIDLSRYYGGQVYIPPQRAELDFQRHVLNPTVVKNAARHLSDMTGTTTIKQFEEYFGPRAASYPNLREWYLSGKPLQCDQDIF
ncbi:hypothetical protein BGW41_001377, partial [Actinomortierella wolfii]